jgi:hypothetical protein
LIPGVVRSLAGTELFDFREIAWAYFQGVRRWKYRLAWSLDMLILIAAYSGRAALHYSTLSNSDLFVPVVLLWKALAATCIIDSPSQKRGLSSRVSWHVVALHRRQFHLE